MPKLELTRRKLLAGAASIGAAGIAMGAGTMALFNDQETDEDNTVQTGDLDLTLNNDSIFTMNPGNLAPGDEVQGTIQLENTGSLPGDHVEFDVSDVSNNDPSTPNDVPANQFARNLWITHLTFAQASGPLFKQVPGLSIHDTEDGSGDLTGFDARANTGNENIKAERRQIGSNHPDAVYVSSQDPFSGNFIQTRDYARSIRDVSAEGVTLGDLAGSGANALSYDWWAGQNNENALPDEVWIVVENPSGRHVAFKNENAGTTGSPPQGESWNRRNVAAELDDGSGAWREFVPSAPDGSSNQIQSIEDPVTAFGAAADLQAVGFGYGFPSSNTGVALEAAFGDLTVNGTQYTFPTRRVNVDSLRQVVVDNMKGLSQNETRGFKLGLRLNPAVGNNYQNEGVDVDLRFRLNQEASQ